MIHPELLIRLRPKEIITDMKPRDKQTGGGEESEDEDEERRRGRRRVVRGRRAASEGREWSEETGRLRWRINELEKEKLELTSTHNQEVRN